MALFKMGRCKARATTALSLSMQIVRVLCVAALAGSVPACDPGWAYRRINPQTTSPGAGSYSISDARAFLFTGTLTVELAIRNNGEGALRIDPKSMRVSTASGLQLPTHFREPACARLRPGHVAVLENREVCELRGEFLVQPLKPPPFRNRDLSRLSVEIAPEGSPNVSRLDFEWQ